MKKAIIIICIIIIIVVLAITILGRKDNEEEIVEDFYIRDGAIYEKTGELNVSGITANLEKINKVFESNLQNMNVYFTIIPDKTYYLENQIDTKFKEIEDKVMENLNAKIQYFEISNALNLADYYRTDMHWKQENILEVVDIINANLKLQNDSIEFEKKNLGEFYGSYYKEIQSNLSPDELKYLSNDVIENSVVYNEETKTDEKVYNLNKVEQTGNKYDMFLSGAAAIETIKNENADTDKKLIIFRDSFGSSLAPLLIHNYEEIVLIDLRYVNYSILSNFIDFSDYENQDVLFVYSSRVINKNGIFR